MSQTNFYSAIDKVNEVSFMFFFDIIEVSHSFSSLRVKLDALDEVVDVNSEPLSDVASSLISADNSVVNTPVNTPLVPVCGGSNSSVNTGGEIFVVDDFCDEFFPEFMIDELPTDDFSIADNSVDEVADNSVDEVVDEVADNSVDEVVDEVADNSVDEVVDELADNSVDEVVDEVADNSVDEVVDEVADNSVDEVVDELADNSVDEVADNSVVNDLVVCIPSLGRSQIIQEKTISTLQKFNIPAELVYVFVVQDEYDDYYNAVGEYCHLVAGVSGLVNQRNFIENYFDEGKHIVMLDDDVADIDLSLTDFETLYDFFLSAFMKCQDENSFIWSVYPVDNRWFRERTTCDMTTHLNFCVGAFYGIINRPNHSKLVLNKYLNGDEKEDILRTLLYFINDGVVLRFNKVGFKTKYYGRVGGMGTARDRFASSASACNVLFNHFGDYGKMWVRNRGCNRGMTEFKLKPSMRFNNDRTVCLLPKIDDLLINQLYEELQKVTIKKLGSSIRTGFQSSNRSVVFGISKNRVSRVVGLSASSKKFPHIWDLLQQIGSQLPADFEYTSVFLNHNVVCGAHRDKNNVGKSILLSFGEYSGCNIVIDGVQYDANRQPVLFNGALLEHYNTDDLVGNKYSIVFFKGNYEVPTNDEVDEPIVETSDEPSDEPIDEPEQCPVCWENFQEGKIEMGKFCAHPICSNCCDELHQAHRYNDVKCPMCREKWNIRRGRGRPSRILSDEQ